MRSLHRTGQSSQKAAPSVSGPSTAISRGRSGTADAQVYLSSVETAVSCALTGVITDPRSMGELCEIPMPEKLRMQPALIVEPPDSEEAREVELIRGPNIKPIELRGELPEKVQGTVLISWKTISPPIPSCRPGVYLSPAPNVP